MIKFTKNLYFFGIFYYIIYMPKFKVKEFVARLGITQKELAPMVGVKPETVYKWAAGTNTPTYDVIYKLKKMGATDYDLFGETFAEQEDALRHRVNDSLCRFLSDLGINAKTKESL